MRARSAGLLAALGLWALSLSCGDIAAIGESCDKAQDCPAPWVCCNELRLPDGDPLPVCEEIGKCVTYMPIMAEGQPCDRLPGQTSLDEQCRVELECCQDTLTCAAPGQCPAPPADPPATGSGLACANDTECAGGELCCGIAFRIRSGACTTVAQCLSGDIPIPDPTCTGGQQLCNGACIDTLSDDLNCGTCGQRCSGGTFCDQGVCESKQLACVAPFVDCNGDPSDNCETDTDRNRVNCGACGNVCPMSYRGGSDLGCRQGVCAYVCNGGFHDCNGSPVDGCESTMRCR